MVTTINDEIDSGENDHNHAGDGDSKRKNHHSGNKNVEIGVAYLKSSGSFESKSMQNAINNNHLNNNNVMVDAYESPPTTMELECVAGYDGGLPQHFVLEAYDSRTKKLRLNITSAFSDIPLFRIDLAGMFNVHLWFMFLFYDIRNGIVSTVNSLLFEKVYYDSIHVRNVHFERFVFRFHFSHSRYFADTTMTG